MICLFGFFQNKAYEFCFGSREPKLKLSMEVGVGEAEAGGQGYTGVYKGYRIVKQV